MEPGQASKLVSWMKEDGKLGREPRPLADRELRPLCESIIDLPSQSAECSCMVSLDKSQQKATNQTVRK